MNRRLIVVALAVAMLAGLLLWARHSGGDSGVVQPETSPAAATSTPVADPATADLDGDTGDVDVSDSPAVVTAGERDPREFAVQFAVKLLNTQGRSPEQWRAGLRPFLTTELAEMYADVDPEQVPAGVVGNPVTVAPAGDALLLVSVPVVDGLYPPRPVATLQVTLTGGSGRWLASELDVTR